MKICTACQSGKPSFCAYYCSLDFFYRFKVRELKNIINGCLRQYYFVLEYDFNNIFL